MARGNITSPPTAASLPKAEFEIINDEKLKLPGGTHDIQARSFGYNKFDDFQRPEHYIRHIEPLESDLAKTVEYDMDEQDQEWLDAINAERNKAQIDKVSCESFEIIMDRLEKEWYDLTKNIPKPDFAMPSEDSTCAICDDSEGENSNAIVFCDGCNLAVHQDCYGVPYIPEGQWLCRKCTVSPEVPVDCYLCPNEGGAFKQAVGGEWVHLLCAIWIPETRVANDVFMEPITGLEKISKQRWKLRCSICDYRGGACIQCTKPSCFVAFHATCARKEKLLMPMKSMQGAEPASLTCFCDRHLPKEQQEIRMAALEQEAAREQTGPSKELATKSARAYAKTYKPGPPLVPAIIVERINRYINRIKIRKKVEFIQQLSRYWSLKREARRGAPLLKRLHLEPWTANAGAKVLTHEEKTMRLDQLIRLRQDLLNVQGLTDLLRKRETRKLRQTEVIHEVLSQGLFSHHSRLRFAFERIMSFDRQDHFKMPVSKQDVPDYYEIIKNPMCWSYIDAKLDQHQYWDLQSFIDDVELVIQNALTYNKSGTTFHKLATRIHKDTRPILAELQSLRFKHEELPPHEQEVRFDSDTDTQILPALGDLEPPLSLLKLFVSSEAIKQGLNMELNTDPASALFNFEFAKVRPPPPISPEAPPAPPPAPRVKKVPKKRDYKAEMERARINKERRQARATAKSSVEGTEVGVEGADNDDRPTELGAATERQDENQIPHPAENGEYLPAMALSASEEPDLPPNFNASVGFRPPRTRGAIAASAAFEAEAHAPPSPEPMPSPDPIPQGDQPGLAGSNESSSETEKPKSKRGPSISTHVQLSIPQVVHDVDNRDSFKMFNAGWILPNDQKRGGRVATDRPPLPPPRKRQRTEPSRLSVISTEPSDNHTLRKTPPLSAEIQEQKHNPNDYDDHAMDIDSPGPSHFHELPSASRHATPYVADPYEGPHNVITQPNGVIIIEKLDSPATRREKYMRRRADKQRKVADGADGSAIVMSTDSGKTSDRRSSPLTMPQFSSHVREPVTTEAPPKIIPDSPEQVTHKRPDIDAGETHRMDIDQTGTLRPSASRDTDVHDDSGLPPPLSRMPSQPQHSPRRPLPLSSPTSKAGPSRSNVAGVENDFDDESELSALSSDIDEPQDELPQESSTADVEVKSELTHTEPEASPTAVTHNPRSKPKKRGRPTEVFDNGTIVWAKSESYPWWPAVVYAETNKDVPANILAVHKDKKIRKKQKLYIVQYYDKQSSWSSVAKDKLQLLGEDDKLDEEMLTPNPKQKFKTPALRQQCREAYRIARSEIEAEGDSGETGNEDADDADGESEDGESES